MFVARGVVPCLWREQRQAGACPWRPTLNAEVAVVGLMNRPVEGWGLTPGRLVRCDTTNPFAQAAHDAFYGHHPLRIRPDDIWLCVAQGLAAHVNQNAESLRERLVGHDEKLTLLVVRPDFFLGQPNPWPEVFEEFSTQIGRHVGKLRDLVAQTFSTSGPLERAAFEMAVMDIFQGYFEYEMAAGCGIPEVILEGTVGDWRSVVVRTAHLAEYGLGRWTQALVPVLERIVQTLEGDCDPAFWRSFFRYESGSGPAELTGWINLLFPYIDEGQGLVWNRFMDDWSSRWARAETGGSLFESRRSVEGPGLWTLPGGQVSAPVKYTQFPQGTEHSLRFVAGHFGIHQAESDGTLSPAFGWAVIHSEADPLRTPERIAEIAFEGL